MRVAHVVAAPHPASEIPQHSSSGERVVGTPGHAGSVGSAPGRRASGRPPPARAARAAPAPGERRVDSRQRVGLPRRDRVQYYSLDISVRYIGVHKLGDSVKPDSQRERTTVLELAILGLLQEQPRHGYELKKRLSETLGSFWGISFGSLYPALRRLERSGAIEVVDGRAPTAPATVPAIPATGSLKGEAAAARLRLVPAPTGRRTRKAYRITPFGQEQFLALLTADDGGDDERLFSLKLAFCRFLDPPARLVVPRAPPRRARRPPRPRPAHPRPGRRSLHPLPHGAPHPIHRARPRVDRRPDRNRRRNRPTAEAPPPLRARPNRKEQPHERCPSEDPCRHRRGRQLRQQPAARRGVLPHGRSRTRTSRA